MVAENFEAGVQIFKQGARVGLDVGFGFGGSHFGTSIR
jgi:hypothetical protein